MLCFGFRHKQHLIRRNKALDWLKISVLKNSRIVLLPKTAGYVCSSPLKTPDSDATKTTGKCIQLSLKIYSDGSWTAAAHLPDYLDCMKPTLSPLPPAATGS